jgi:excisionase family DNA binding protein
VSEKLLFTPAEAAQLLRCCTETVCRRIRRGDIKAGRRGGGRNPYLIAKAEMDRLVQDAAGMAKQ